MTFRVIRYDDHELVPWKNGLGMTREVANAHDGKGAMIWRISLATVDRDGPFSDFAGCDRIIMMLEGDGMRLDFGDHGAAMLDRPFVPVVFDGAWPTSATLPGGPTRDLNVVTAQGRASAEVVVIELDADGTELPASRGLTLVHVLRGAVRAGDDELATGDTLRVDGGALPPLAASGDTALVYRIDIDLAPGAADC